MSYPVNGVDTNGEGGLRDRSSETGAIALVDEESGLHGLEFRSELELDGDSVTAPIPDSYGKFGYGTYHHICPLCRVTAPNPRCATMGPTPPITKRLTRACLNVGAPIPLIARQSPRMGRAQESRS